MVLKYPEDLSDKYYASISFMEYVRPDPFQSLINVMQIQDEGGELLLPMPQNLIDSQQLKWSQNSNILAETLNSAWNVAMVDGDVSKFATSIAAAGLNTPGAITEFLTGNGNSNIARAGQRLADGAGNIAQAGAQIMGLSINPVLSVMFEYPEFKGHSFTWKFAPNNPKESQKVQGIIEAFRVNSLPNVELNGLFFKYPSIVKMRLRAGDGDVYKFQQCVINSVEVNYAANQAQLPSFFAGTSLPTIITLKVDLLEIVMNTRNNTKPNAPTSFTPSSELDRFKKMFNTGLAKKSN